VDTNSCWNLYKCQFSLQHIRTSQLRNRLYYGRHGDLDDTRASSKEEDAVASERAVHTRWIVRSPLHPFSERNKLMLGTTHSSGIVGIIKTVEAQNAARKFKDPAAWVYLI
jgi:hypothetical protein